LLPQSEKLNQAVAILNEHEGLDKLASTALANNSHKQGVLNRFIPQETVIESVSADEDAEYTAFQEKLQVIYKGLADLAKSNGEQPDDFLATISNGAVKAQQDLENCTVQELDSIMAAIAAELAKGDGGDLFNTK
jgi:beta-mannanase